MDPTIEAVREQIAGEQGEPFLRLMRDLYVGAELAWWDAARTLRRDVLELGLARAGAGGPSLTACGYVVGNVAKEYCNWLEHGRSMPAPRPSPEMVAGKDVLDLGCGFGRWLWEFQTSARSVVGIELQREYLELGEALARREGRPVPKIHCVSAEQIDAVVPAASVDLVFSRLMLTHVAIRRTLAAIAGRLRPGGILWVQVESLRYRCRSLLAARRLRSAAFDAFAIANSAVLMASGIQLAVHSCGRMHSTHRAAHPTLAWRRCAAARAGLTEFHVVKRAAETVSFWARR